MRKSNLDLDWLNDALREVEEPEEDLLPEVEFEPETLSGEDWYLEFLPEENPAVDFGRTLYADEDFEEPFAAEAVSDRARRKEQQLARAREKKEKKEKKKKKKGIGGLVLLALAEMAAILYLLRWWIIWLT